MQLAIFSASASPAAGIIGVHLHSQLSCSLSESGTKDWVLIRTLNELKSLVLVLDKEVAELDQDPQLRENRDQQAWILSS